MTSVRLLDNSAWARLNDPRVAPDRIQAITEWIAERVMWVSTILRLEAGHAARDRASFDELEDLFGSLPSAEIDRSACRRALAIQRQLVASGHHRMPIADVLTAAVAESRGLTILHYDKDFDIILDKTDCVASAEWLAPRGTL